MALSDADRQAAVASLRGHAGAGHIDLDQFGDRTAAVLAATSAADLDAVFADLPDGVPTLPSSVPAVRPAAPRPRPWSNVPGVARLAPVAPLFVLFVAIWALTGFGYFWPAWPILGISIGTLKRGACGRRRAYWV